MKTRSSKTLPTLVKGLIIPAALFALLLVQGCDSLAFRDTIISTLGDDNPQTQLVISDNGAVLASGPVQKVASQSFDLAGVTFAVTGKTSMMDQSGAALSLSDLEVGLGLEVDGTRLDDGSFEASFAEVTSALSGESNPNARGRDGNGEKVVICHIPPGNPDNARTKTVGASAAAAHLAHGDTEGECGPSIQPVDVEESEEGEEGEDNGEDGDRTAVCHVPPGNPDRARTIYIDASGVQAHLNHGDTEGECEIQPADPEGG